ncbi:acyltransferase [Pseudoxanthomonas broegbernensis]|uniref:acyltransferase n=1 Tax=Pseudoxanthomonas broegbernensis TaxID=83619 RepID=UPI001836115F|nr:1-acyl-sn-glycerol-3-phosphate acyltransferase [Pseudoxanthomonas broegbernensis]
MSFLLWLRIALILPLVVLNTLVHALPLLAVALFKAALPFRPVRRAANPALTGLAESWIAVNSAMIGVFTDTAFQVDQDASLRRDGHYLVLANHQSWVDILVLQKVFNRRIPLLRFFLKRQLFWVPVLGLAWWALDFPFMGRYTRRQIARNPELGKRDIEVTRRACAKFRDIPVSVMNFVEGTRFTPAKHAGQASPYRYLLKPKSGGVAFVLDAMGDGLHAMVDVAIAYPAGRPTMLDLMANRVPLVRVRVRQRPIPAELVAGNYQDDRAFRARFQQWMNGVWQEKDADLARLLDEGSAAVPGAGGVDGA